MEGLLMIKYSDIRTLLKRITKDEDANFEMKRAEIDISDHMSLQLRFLRM